MSRTTFAVIARAGLIGAVAAVLAGYTPSSSAAAGKDDTLKERLSDKASDEQRVNDCKVPLEKRGPTVRPSDCASDVAQSPGVRADANRAATVQPPAAPAPSAPR